MGDAPRGTVVGHVLEDCRAFPGTKRRWWTYVPAQYDTARPAALTVFQDGHAWLDPAGDIRATTVMDNLIHRGEMPVTVGVFVDPGIFRAELPERLGWDPKPENRNVEYDTLSDAYAEFLLTEILPAVREEHVLTDDAEHWAIGGMSSGGICAFTVAWERPDRFRRVLSLAGSFANVRGGQRYPELVRTAPPKPLRVFLQVGSGDDTRDADGLDWHTANLRMASALAQRGYDTRLVVGEGGHDPVEAGATLPEALRWLWRTAAR